jgi:Xaa-Pro aminopeptidase
LLNIRGSDVPFNPVMLGDCVVHSDLTVEIYTDVNKIDDDVLTQLGSNVMVKGFTTVEESFTQLTGKIGMDFATVPVGLKFAVEKGNGQIIDSGDIARSKKAFKNEAEQEAMRQCHIVDGAVMARMLHWVDTTPIEQQDEWTNALKLEDFRRQAQGFKDFSFDSISGFGANGAICHYRVNEQTALKFETDNLYLLDSGTQYENGTTDITRTMPIGRPSAQHIHNFTLVLKGLIALTRAKFPKNYTAEQLDCIARAPLFNECKNYDHGTGHGVGAALNVHEGPLYFSNKGRNVTMDVGAVLSNEPGYYVADDYGIRIENLMIAQPADVDGWLQWESITWCPIDYRLIDVTLLDKTELDWLNNYHKTVWEKVSPLLDGENNVLNWLETMCQKIVK